MYILQIIVALSWLWIPLLVIYLIVRHNKNSSQNQAFDGNILNNARDESWLDYLRSFQGVVKTKAEKHLIETLVAGKSADELYRSRPTVQAAPASVAMQEAAAAPGLVTAVPAAEEAIPQLSSPEYQPPSKPSAPVDNTILLLYFGAFLLVASVGLFVAISGLAGIARTAIVALTAAVLYGGGLWLYQNNKKLEQAGLSFVGTGMIITPLIGVAWYNFVADKENGGIIWLLTSIACIALYVHAYGKIKNDFISYLLIGSFVSAVESAVLTIDLPSYGYAWGLVAAGLLLTVTNRNSTQDKQLQAASTTSSHLLIPLSVLGSLVLLPEFGTFQLAVTLIMAGVYYSLLAWWQPGQRTEFSQGSQLSYVAAAASLVYSLDNSVGATGICLLVIGALYTLAVNSIDLPTIRTHNLITMAGVVLSASVLLCLGEAWPLTGSLAIAVVLCGIVWRRLESDTALQTGSLTLLILPFVAGLYALQLEVTSWAQLGLCAAGAVILLLLAVLCGENGSSYKRYRETTSLLYIVAASLLFIPAWNLGDDAIWLVTAGIFMSFGLLWRLSKDADWLTGMSFVLLLPFAHAMLTQGIDTRQFSVGLGVALAGNIIISLLTRQAITRYVVVGCILLAPLAIGGGGLGFKWDATGYAGGYLLAMVSCVLARTIARGKLLVSDKVPISSFSAEASEAYVGGYTTAGVLALCISFAAANSQLVTSLVLAVIGLIIVVVAQIERNSQLYALLPLIAQGLLFSALRPDLGDAQATGIMAIISVLTAVASYGLVTLLDPSQKNAASRSVNLISVAAAYIGPALVISQTDPSLLLPVSLMIAGALTYFYNRYAGHGIQELSVAVCIASVHWFAYLLGYTNIHFHTHMLAFFLAAFAVWRSSINDAAGSRTYVQALFFVVTVPLALQAMGGENGDMYGIILIAEQVGFMLYGAHFGQRFLLRWGLWTGLAAILFQLRGLSWAFVSLLALIVIGVAVYRLQKHPADDPPPAERTPKL